MFLFSLLLITFDAFFLIISPKPLILCSTRFQEQSNNTYHILWNRQHFNTCRFHKTIFIWCCLHEFPHLPQIIDSSYHSFQIHCFLLVKFSMQRLKLYLCSRSLLQRRLFWLPRLEIHNLATFLWFLGLLK